ncbi:MAG: glycosyltransferase family 2 protein [Agrococcus casei]|uniref:glycosyltransferase family 2 protein n=1 Tax=Agrococcus casei TaxID=343512 RepID=UPI003F8FC378
MNPSVSIALCSHNGGRHIAEQVQSILDQSVPVDEIVLGDDASTDDTVEIVRSLVEPTTTRLVVREHSPALGVRNNFADAIAHTSGDVVALCDQDDRWHPARLERLLPSLVEANLVHSDANLVDANLSPLEVRLLDALEASRWEREMLQGGDALSVLLRRNLVTGATTVMRGDFARRALPIPEGWIHDEWLGILAALEGSLRLVPDALTDYRQHDANEIGVQKLSLAAKFSKLTAPDGGAHRRKALRATNLAQAVFDRGLGTPAQRQMLIEKARHERTRATMPTWLPGRLPAVIRGAWRGNYRRYSRGALDIARDLLERR